MHDRKFLPILIGLTVVLPLVQLAMAEEWAVSSPQPDSRFRGLGVVDDRVAWVSGTRGNVLRTGDGGQSWTTVSIPEAATLDLRDIEGFDDRSACVLSAGPGSDSRIYTTDDAGASWQERHVNREPRGFLDAIAFWNRRQGLVMGDPVNGRFTILTTDDAGASWQPIDPAGMPPALPGEGGFAASGTCLAVFGNGHAWFGTGGAERARIFRSTDWGRTWTVHDTPVIAGRPSAGIFSVAFRSPEVGVAIGGDFQQPDARERLVALTTDGGRTWQAPEGTSPGGYRSAVAWRAEPEGRLIAVGPTGADVSEDGGRSWRPIPGPGFDAIHAASKRLWASGDKGRIGRLGPP